MPSPPRQPLVLGLSAAGLTALLGSPDWRLSVIAALGALLTCFWPAAARAPIALLAAMAAVTGSPALAAGVALLLLALARGSRVQALRALGAAGLLASLAALVLREAMVAAACFLVLALVVAPVEQLSPRRLRALGLLLASLHGVWMAGTIYRSLRGEVDPSSPEFPQLIERVHRAGLHSLEGSLRLAWATTLSSEGHLEQARSTLEGIPEPREPRAELALADLEVRTGQEPQARFRLWRLAASAPKALGTSWLKLADRTAELWSRALLRRGNRLPALAAAQGLPSGEGAALRAAASAKPTAALDGVSFSGAIRLLASQGPDHCVPAGASAPFTWTWELESGFSPGEDFYVFVHAYGPHTELGADHLVPRSLRRGERWIDPGAIPVPASAPPGHYHVDIGLYDPADSVRLQPSERPEHQSYAEGGSFEVCP